MDIRVNEVNTPIDDLDLDNVPKEVRDQFFDFITNVEFIKSLIDKDRPKAKDLPRDKEGKIIVDVTKPHILENMDYFRPTAIHYQKTGKVCDYRPNNNPNSDYAKWFAEEKRRCHNGYVRESDGEWIPGDLYFFWNYCPILLSKHVDGKKKANRVWDFPDVWEGHYLKYHYQDQARDNGEHSAELAARGKGKSFSLASKIAKRFILGDNEEACKEVRCVVSAANKEYLVKDGVLNKFESYINFCAEHTEFPRKRLIDTLNNMHWQMGYIENKTNITKGSQNEVIGVSSNDDISKLRGKRGSIVAIEEFGSFPKLLQLYQSLRPSVEDGDEVFGQIILQGTAGDKESDFQSANELMYSPRGYNIKALDNVYDKTGKARKDFCFFFPEYMNRKGSYDKNGNSDVTKALLKILLARYQTKYNSVDPNALVKQIAEWPITPSEAILKTQNNLFPVSDLNERLAQIDNNPSIFDNVLVGELVPNDKSNNYDFKPTVNDPIRTYPLKNNKVEGAIEIFAQPIRDHNGKIPEGRYIIGNDPFDDDSSNTMSLMSTFVYDMFTDKIVAEWTGRLPYAENCYEIVRRLCFYYNAKCLYENNKKGLFAYFSKMRCLHMLADKPSHILTDSDSVKGEAIGNKSKGFNATQGINNYANRLIRDWLLELDVVTNDEGNQTDQLRIYSIMNRALIQELIAYDSFNNFDRVRAFGAVMLYRAELSALYGGKDNMIQKNIPDTYLGNDDFFKKNYRLSNQLNRKDF